MFGVDLIVLEPIGFCGRVLQDPLGLGAEWDLNRSRHPFTKDGPALDFLSYRVNGDMRAAEEWTYLSLSFANEPKQKMLGLD